MSGKGFRRLIDIDNMLPKSGAKGEIPTTREAYGNLFGIAFPSVLEMVLISLIGMIDTIMVSSINTDAVAAVGLVGQPRMLTLCIFFALNVGITAVIARRKGEERRDEANRTLRNAILLIVGISAVMMAGILPFASGLMKFAGAEAGRTLENATTYFKILTYILPLNALSMAICAAQRGIGNTKLTMYVNIISNLVNVLFNWLLINGIWIFPQLGVTGAAIATAIGMCVGFLLCVYSLLSGRRHDAFLRISVHDDWRLNKETISSVFKVSSSAMIEQIAMRIGFFSYAKIVAGLGTDAFAAHQIAMQFLNLSFCFGDGIGVAGTSLVGQMLGRKRSDLSHIYGLIAQRLAFAVALVLATCCIVLRAPLVSMFIKPDAGDNVRRLAEILMIVVASFQPFQMSAVVISGALRGAGDTKYTARIMMLTVAVMRPVLAFVAVYGIGKWLKLGETALIGAWLAALIDMITRMILMMKRYSSGKWHNIKV